MERRKLMKSLAVGGTIVLAGCSGNDGDNQSIPKPDEDADPEDLLPDPPEGWEQTLSNEQQAGMIGAVESHVRNYNSPDGREYAVECNRFANEGDAAADEYPSDIYSVHVVNGVFTFAGRGPDTDQLIMLMATSSVLTADFIRDNNNL